MDLDATMYKVVYTLGRAGIQARTLRYVKLLIKPYKGFVARLKTRRLPVHSLTDFDVAALVLLCARCLARDEIRVQVWMMVVWLIGMANLPFRALRHVRGHFAHEDNPNDAYKHKT